MTTGVDALSKLLAHRAPHFRCFAAGKKDGPRELIRVEHVSRPAAGERSLTDAARILGPAFEPFLSILRRCDGFTLFKDPRSHAAALRFMPVIDWPSAAKSLEDWRRSFEPTRAELSAMMKSYAPIAEIPLSPDFVVVSVVGESLGHVFVMSHEEWEPQPLAPSIDALLGRLLDDPIPLIRKEFGSVARYSDGATELQWIPEAYFDDAVAVGPAGL